VLSLPPAVKLWYCPDPVEMRLGFDGLYNLVATRLRADPLCGHLFIFHNRSADRLKVLYWGGHGLCLWCQRLEAGRYHFPDPPPETASAELTASQPSAIGTPSARLSLGRVASPQSPPPFHPAREPYTKTVLANKSRCW
jgi:transposase